MITALLVDDEPPARHRLRTLLAAHPDLVVTGEAGDVPDALSRISDDPPDLVFLDVRLAGDDGFELIRLLGAVDAPAIVFVTAHPTTPCARGRSTRSTTCSNRSTRPD